MIFHGWSSDTQGARRLGYFKLTAALPHHILKKHGKLVGIAEGKQLLDIPGEKGIDPFPVKAGLFG